MPPIEDQIQALIDQPSEKLNIELKPWLKPTEKWGQFLIAKSLLALRNQDGGFLLIGFHDDGSPLPLKGNRDVRRDFHVDKIQEIVSRFASKTFSIAVHFRQRDGVYHPVIQVESGIRTPVACKADLFNDNGEQLLCVNDIYVRTLNSNGIASTSKVKAGDLDDVVDRCFQNREADHVAFFSKLLRSLPRSDQETFLAMIGQQNQAQKKFPGEVETRILDAGQGRFLEQASKRNTGLSGLAFLEGALKIEGPLRKQRASEEFLQFLNSANPSLTGWPIWLVSKTFSTEQARSYTYQNAWEQFIDVPGMLGHHLDFMIFSPEGEFYFLRALEDDTHRQTTANSPGVVDPIIQLARVAETLAVGKAFGSVLGDPPDSVKLLFAFRWSGLEGRRLIGWSSPQFDVGTNTPSHQDSVVSFVDLSISANEQEIAEKTKEAIDPLTTAFGGYELHREFVQAQVIKLLQRRL
jgi:hypothetical protein